MPFGRFTTREALINRLTSIGLRGRPDYAAKAINMLLEREDGKAVQPTTALDPNDCTFVLADPDRRDVPADQASPSAGAAHPDAPGQEPDK